MREETRVDGVIECERRADAYGLPALRWPPGWPVESYSLTALRAAWVAADHGLLQEFTHAAFERNFVTAVGLRSLEDTLAVAKAVGLDQAAVRIGVEHRVIKERLRSATDGALARGVIGVPTVAGGDDLFWGDDQLENAARFLRVDPHANP